MSADTRDLPSHVGRITDAETGNALVCNAAVGDPNTDAICGQPATHHIRWVDEATENSLACGDHYLMALHFGPFDTHSVENSACGMPGSCWVLGDPSHCTMLALDEEPVLAAEAVMVDA